MYVQAIESVAHDVAKRAEQQESAPLLLARLQLGVEHAFDAQRKLVSDERSQSMAKVDTQLQQILAVRKSNPTIQEITALYDQVLYSKCAWHPMAACIGAQNHLLGTSMFASAKWRLAQRSHDWPIIATLGCCSDFYFFVQRLHHMVLCCVASRKAGLCRQACSVTVSSVQVVFFVCMAGCLEAALSDITAEQEVRAALESVFPFSMLAQFITLPAEDKKQQLRELPLIVLGICLYNQAQGLIRGRVLNAMLAHSPADMAAQQAQCVAQADVARVMLQGYTRAHQGGHFAC